MRATTSLRCTKFGQHFGRTGKDRARSIDSLQMLEAQICKICGFASRRSEVAWVRTSLSLALLCPKDRTRLNISTRTVRDRTDLPQRFLRKCCLTPAPLKPTPEPLRRIPLVSLVERLMTQFGSGQHAIMIAP